MSYPLFKAPIDIKENDVITCLFGHPAIIERDGVEIWRNKDIPDYVFSAIIGTPNKACTGLAGTEAADGDGSEPANQ